MIGSAKCYVIYMLVLFLQTIIFAQINPLDIELKLKDKPGPPVQPQLDVLDLLYTLGPELPPSGLNADQVGMRIAQVGDINNDGYTDWIVGLPSAQDYDTGITGGTVHIYYGRDQIVGESRADLVITAPQYCYGFGFHLAGAGDVNNDSYNDLLIYSYWSDDNYVTIEERVHLFYGGDPMDLIPDKTFEMPPGNNVFGRSLSCAGDVNNDGFDDILIGAPSNSGWPEIGRVYLYFGGSDMDNVSDVVFEGESEPNYGVTAFGASAASAGDINNDGYDDVIVGAQTKVADGSGGAVHLYLGSAEMDNIADLSVRNIAGCGFSAIVAGAGDVNNDGYDDIVAGAHIAGIAYVYYGGETPDNVSDVRLHGGILGNQFETHFLSGAGDVNGDQIDDVVFGLNHTGPGAVYVFNGGTPMDSIPDMIAFGDIIGDRFGYAVSGGGDLDNDGFCDILIGSAGNFNTSSSDDDQGHIYIYRGGETMDNEADAVYTGAAEGGVGFGRSVAWVGDVNNDSYPDLMVGIPNFYSYPFYVGQTLLYYGSANPQNEPSVIFNSVRKNVHGNFGHLSAAGDFNNDGFDDVIIAEGNSYISNRYVYLYLGGAGMDTLPDLDIRQDLDIGLENMAVVGDVNDDGYDDILLVPGDQALLYYGADSLWRFPALTFDNTQPSATRAGDLNGDGISEL